MEPHVPNAKLGEMYQEMMATTPPGTPPRVETIWWHQLAWGHYVIDQTTKTWLVLGQAMGWTRLQDMNGLEISVPPQPADKTALVVVIPEDRALLLLERCLGASQIKDDFKIAKQLITAERWAVPLMPATGGEKELAKLRQHVEWFHRNHYLNDIKEVDALASAHEELHAEIEREPMFMPHHHSPNARPSKGSRP